MKTFAFKIDETEYELRLKSSDAIKIESLYKVKLLDYIQDYSITTLVTLLRYMLKGGMNKEVTEKEAYEFYDKLVDNNYAIETILEEIILPACEASGLLTKSDLETVKTKKEQARVKATQM